LNTFTKFVTENSGFSKIKSSQNIDITNINDDRIIENKMYTLNMTNKINDTNEPNVNTISKYDEYIINTESRKHVLDEQINKIAKVFSSVYEYSTLGHIQIGMSDILSGKRPKSLEILEELDAVYNGGYYVQSLSTENVDICTQCGSKCTYNSINKAYTCPSCGLGFYTSEIDFSQMFGDNSTSVNLVDASQSFHAPSAHDRVKHLVGYLDRIMGVDMVNVPKHVTDIIDREMKRDRITADSAFFNNTLLKKYLKNNGLNAWIKYTAKIYREYTGRNMITPLTDQERGSIIEMWTIILRHVTTYMVLYSDRKNFPSAWYFLRKITEHLNIDIQIDQFHKIKLDNNTTKLDTIWKYVCNKIGIQFVPTR